MKPNSPSLTQIRHQQHHPANQTHFPKQQTPPTSLKIPSPMETHKKLIKPTPLLSIKPNLENPKKPDQTHTTIADQTQPQKPKKTWPNPHHHCQSSRKYPTPWKHRIARSHSHNYHRSSWKNPALQKPNKTWSNPLYHCRSNPHHHHLSNNK